MFNRIRSIIFQMYIGIDSIYTDNIFRVKIGENSYSFGAKYMFFIYI